MKKIIVKFWPVLLIFFTWFIFASPYFLKSQVPFPSTYQVNNFAPWSTNEKFWGPVKNGAMPDIITQIYPWKYFTIQTYKMGQIPLWNPYSFSGTPHLANYQSAVLSPFNLLFFIFSFIDAWSILILLQPLLAGFFTYLFARALKVSKIGSLVSAISFMFCGFLTAWMGYGTLGYAILFLPLALFSIEKFYESKKIRFLILLSISIPIAFFSGHFQINLYFLFFLIIYIFYKFSQKRNVFSTGCILFYVLLGLMITLPQLLPSIEFYKQSFRSQLFQKSESIPLAYLPTLLAPDFFGNPVTRNDWFGHYAEWNAYIGVLPLLLAIYSFFRGRKSQTVFFFIFGLLALFLAFNTPLVDILISLRLPVFSTSAISRIIVLFSFSFSILSGIGLDHLIEDLNKNKKKDIIKFFSGFVFIFTVLWIIVVFSNFMPIDKLRVAKSNLMLPSFIFIVFLFIVFSNIYIKRRKILIFTSYIIVFIVAFDMLRFAIKWQPFDPRNLVFPNVPVTNFFKKVSDHERVFGNLGGEATIYYNLPSVEGYDALYIKRYGEFIGSLDDGKVKNSARSVVAFPKQGLYTSEAINLLGIKYIVHKVGDGHAGWTFPFWIYPQSQFNLVYNDDKYYQIFNNTKVYPRAFLTGKYKVILSPQSSIDAIFSQSNLNKKIILEKDPGFIQSDNQIGKVNIVSYTPNIINLYTETKSKGILFLSDNYYSGWKAEIDGMETPIYRANYTFRAIIVDKGGHKVKFFYDPLSFKLGFYFALVGFVGILLTSLRLSKKTISLKTFPNL